jgi:predicted unusual protein kinase regulating ubiquinone biosynthesis (AarF/ABC1/UbiB family)
LFAGYTSAAVDEFMRFLTPSSRTNITAARQDLMAALNNYVESARVGPDGFALTEGIFEIEMLAVVRAHRMALHPDAVRYLKAVLTAEAMVKELDPQFDLRAYENRFFGRLIEVEIFEATDPRRWGQRLVDARVRLDRILDAIERVDQTPRDLVGLALNVRRRVQWLSGLTIAGWALWFGVARLLDYPVTRLAVGGALITLGLVWFSILEVRRLPSEADVGRLSSYPRRLR